MCNTFRQHFLSGQCSVQVMFIFNIFRLHFSALSSGSTARFFVFRFSAFTFFQLGFPIFHTAFPAFRFSAFPVFRFSAFPKTHCHFARSVLVVAYRLVLSKFSGQKTSINGCFSRAPAPCATAVVVATSAAGTAAASQITVLLGATHTTAPRSVWRISYARPGDESV